jgi:hypothetical protein
MTAETWHRADFYISSTLRRPRGIGSKRAAQHLNQLFTNQVFAAHMRAFGKQADSMHKAILALDLAGIEYVPSDQVGRQLAAMERAQVIETAKHKAELARQAVIADRAGVIEP